MILIASAKVSILSMAAIKRSCASDNDVDIIIVTGCVSTELKENQKLEQSLSPNCYASLCQNSLHSLIFHLSCCDIRDMGDIFALHFLWCTQDCYKPDRDHHRRTNRYDHYHDDHHHNNQHHDMRTGGK